jgi:hypothetical protein
LNPVQVPVGLACTPASWNYSLLPPPQAHFYSCYTPILYAPTTHPLSHRLQGVDLPGCAVPLRKAHFDGRALLGLLLPTPDAALAVLKEAGVKPIATRLAMLYELSTLAL